MKNAAIASVAKTAAKTAAVSIAAAGVLLGFAGPASATAETIYGDPAAAAKYWRFQTWDDCVLMSSADVIGEITGNLPSEDAIIAKAEATPSSQGPGPIYTKPANPDGSGEGTWFRDIPTLLAQYGIGATVSNGNMEVLEHQLGAGHKVLVSLNGEIIWRKPVEDRDEQGNPTHNHTVVVTGVDVATNIVHLNDSGSSDGADEQVPMAIFVQAWQTSNDLMAATT